VPLESLRAQDESVLNELLEAALPPAVEAVDRERHEGPGRAIGGGHVRGDLVDSTLEGAARSTLTRMQDDLKKLQAKVIHAAKKKDETPARQFKNAQAQAFPGGPRRSGWSVSCGS
jgi:hypothetical protein